MKYKRHIFLLISGVLFSIGTARFCHYQTAGFRISKIKNNFFDAPNTATLISIPQGPFTYLGRGLQSFAFLSADEEHVLKIFNNRYQRTLFWLSFLPWCTDAQIRIQEKLNKTTRSYALATQVLSKETGILYAHLKPSEELKTIVLVIDKLGISHPIDLDKTAFIIQKKASPVYTQLCIWRDKNNLDLAEQGISSLIRLIKSRFNRGIVDKDPLIRTNFGFINTEAMQIDVGAFTTEEELNPREEFIRIMTSLKIWVSSNYPLLSPHLEREIDAHAP